MSIKVVLFDLDGTLLPMDQDIFVKAYFKGIAAKLYPRGYEPEALVKAIWKGTEAMIRNNGEKTNEEAFWDLFASIYGEKSREDLPYFDEFYRTKFDDVQGVCGKNEKVKELIKTVKSLGFRTALATNPIFPSIATEKRISWAGLKPEDFEHFTTYENSNYCKPNLKYYETICEKLGVSPAQCLMVGNDVDDDMVAEKLGMKVFLLTDCLINKSETDISNYPHGNIDDLFSFISSL